MRGYLLAGLVLVGAYAARAQQYDAPVRASWTEDASTTATITWDTLEASRGTVRYGLTTNYTHVARDGGGVHRHAITLRGLQPGTRYQYEARSDDGYVSPPASFMTAPFPGEPLHFAVHTDLEGGLEIDSARDVSARIIGENPQWVVHVGDMAEEWYGTGIEPWTHFFDICSNELAQFVFMPTIGNHDAPLLEGDNTEHWLGLYHRLFSLPEPSRGNGWYAYTAGDARFIVLNSEADPTTQTNWLARELQAAASDTQTIWLMSVLHKPPYSWGERSGWDPGKDNWSPLFVQYEVDLVISGHSHNYQRIAPIRGVRYLVAGGGGGRLYTSGANDALEYATTCYHHASIHITGTVMQVRGVRSDGLVFDTASFGHQRHVRVEPAFPLRGEPARVIYRATGGPLASASPVRIHIGQDAFEGAFAEEDMTYNSADGVWEYEFTVPAPASNRLAFVFCDSTRTIWHNNHDHNWQALLGRVRVSPANPAAGSTVTLRYEADMGPLAGSPHIQAWISFNDGRFAPTGFAAMSSVSGQLWEHTLDVPAFAENMTVWFHDGSRVDDDYQRGWTFPVAGPAEAAWPPAPYAPAASPVISDKPTGGAMNHIGDNFDFSMQAPALLTHDAIEGFGDFGELYFNGDSSHFYVGGIGADLGGTNNVFLLFLGFDSLDSGALNLWHKSGLPDALDYLHNLRFTEPMDIAIVFGDQYGDRTDYTNFTYGGYNFGQGIYYIGTNSGSFGVVPGAKLSQFDGYGTTPCDTTNSVHGRTTMRWESAIPWTALGAAEASAVSNLLVAGILASSSVKTNDRYLSRSHIGQAAWGRQDDYGQYGYNSVQIAPVRVNLPHGDLLGDGIPNAFRQTYFGTPDGPAAAEDSDGDGASNWAEYVGGSDPADPASFFTAHGVPEATGADLVIRWPSLAGRRYAVLAATNLLESMTPLQTDIPATPPENTYTDVVHTAVSRIFYRLHVALEE